MRAARPLTTPCPMRRGAAWCAEAISRSRTYFWSKEKEAPSLAIDDETVALLPAGHILGSAQVLMEYDGRRAVVTGDYKTHPDSTAQTFELVPCDLFVTEATFGLPVFQHPDPRPDGTARDPHAGRRRA